MANIQSSLTAEPSGNEKAFTIFEVLDLVNKYTNKFHLKDAQCIRPEIVKMSLEGFCTDPKMLPYLILHKIMSNDIRCRTNLYKKNMESMTPEKESDDESEDESESDDEDSFNPDQLHPVDCLIALLLCCDDLVRRDIFTRLAKCQIAIPLVLPDPFTRQLIIPLWAMRSIYKEWMMVKAKPQQCHHIVSYPMPIVSVVRFGCRQKEGLSKSQILNQLISGEDSHSHFFHRDCGGGEYKQILGEGLVDMTWYLPSDQKSYEKAITFLNLHGDAYEFPKQVEFLSQISSVIFVMICDQNICKSIVEENILPLFSTKPTILNATKKSMKNIFSNLKSIKVASKTANEISSKMWEHIKAKVRGINQNTNSIVNLIEQTIRDSIFSIDEQESIHKGSSKHATDIIACINDQKTATKEDILPLQSDLWKSWAKLKKESYRHKHKGTYTVDEYAHKMDHDLEIIRSKQRSLIEEMSPVMKCFIQSLLSTMGAENCFLRTYFLQDLILELDKFSMLKLEQKEVEYKVAKKEIANSESKHKQLIEHEILEHSFGLEHLLREVGQIYEAYSGCDGQHDYCSQLSMAVAQLLIDGYPIELMDGDAAHVPMHWVTAVLQQAVKILENDDKVYVVSVLGLQSSGKSTMLNTTFGVQFKVSEGRCTRGAFMQLLPFDTELQSLTGCSYVLIVDTEGLKAIDPDTDENQRQEHDNELATFVIGLANLTLVNIRGESPGDLDDILQTSVHAFLRMNEIDIDSSCYFIHQNASQNTKSDIGRTQFTRQLNKFTNIAAIEEKCEGKYKCFNDIIKYDDSTDAHYFLGLWKGDLPMAPVNPGYSNSAQCLKMHFINALDKSTHHLFRNGLSITSFCVRVSALWTALLKENFVFSFRNMQEILLYTSLEVEYTKWNQSFMKDIIGWESTACNLIHSADLSEVSQLRNTIITDLVTKVNDYYKIAEAEMNKYFEDQLEGTLMKWKDDFKLKLHHQKDKLYQSSLKRLNDLIEAKEVLIIFEKRKNRIIDKIKLKVQNTIDEFKNEQKELRRAIKQNILSNSQIQALSKRKMFTSDKMEVYVNIGISQSALEKIQAKKKEYQGDIPDSELHQILCSLSLEEVDKILKYSTQSKSKKELEEGFDIIWNGFIESVSKFECIEIDKIEADVETALLEYVGPQGGNSRLSDMLLQKPLHDYKEEDFTSQFTDSHISYTGYKPPDGQIQKMVSKLKDLIYEDKFFETVLKEITDNIFFQTKQYGCDITRRKINFSSVLVCELLHYVEQTISNEEAKQDRIQLTNQYKHEIYIRICGFMIPHFHKMAKSFADRCDPRQHLEDFERKPLLIKYQNQYQQIETEEAVASTLCAYLEEQIKNQVKRTLGGVIVSKLSTLKHFSNKRELKVQVLLDLLKKDDFDSYIVFIKDIKTCMVDHIQKYIVEFCDKRAPNEHRSGLQEAAFENVSQVMRKVSTIIMKPMPDKITLGKWLSTICLDPSFSKIGVKLAPKDIICDHEPSCKLDSNNFQKIMDGHLQKLKENVSDSFKECKATSEMKYWDIKPDEMFKDLIGCTAQCPFCGEQCDRMNHTADKTKHYAEVHQIDCIDGWTEVRTQVMYPNVCNMLVDSDGQFFRKSDQKCFHYEDYGDAHPDWYIPPNKTIECTLYWKWFTCKYEAKLLERYQANRMKYPNDWKKIDKAGIEKDLRRAYRLN